MKKLSLLFLMLALITPIFATNSNQGYVNFHDLNSNDYMLVMDVSCSNALPGFCPGPMVFFTNSSPLSYTDTVTVLRAAIFNKQYQSRKITQDIANAGCLIIHAPQELHINIDSSGKIVSITCPHN